jgi:hypothetical protein
MYNAWVFFPGDAVQVPVLSHASLTFIVPKADPSVLPHWVNDYHALNANTVVDTHLLPRIDDILTDCAKGKIWSKLDMTNSFFQTHVHPDDVHLTVRGLPNHLESYSRICGGFQRYILCKLNTERGNKPVGVSKEKSLKETQASHRFDIYTIEL